MLREKLEILQHQQFCYKSHCRSLILMIQNKDIKKRKIMAMSILDRMRRNRIIILHHSFYIIQVSFFKLSWRQSFGTYSLSINLNMMADNSSSKA